MTADAPRARPIVDQEFRALIPPLSPEEHRQLEHNLLAAGGARDPLTCWRGLLLDGHNRFEICERHGLRFTVVPVDAGEVADRDAARMWIITHQLGRRNLQLFQRGELALKLEPLIAAQAKAQQRAAGGAVPQKSTEPPIDTRAELARLAGVSHNTIAKVKVIAERAPEDVKDKLRRGDSDISINSAYQDIRGDERRAGRIVRLQALSANNVPLGGTAPVPVLYVDPPWRFEFTQTDNRAIENHYPTMCLEDICALPVNAAATSDAILFLWTPSAKLADAVHVIGAWGFLYRTCMVWVKESIGTGNWARQQHELLLIAIKGAPPTPLPATLSSSVVHAPRGAHSVKPEVFYELIERMYPELPKRELFARQARAGWETPWGNEAAGVGIDLPF